MSKALIAYYSYSKNTEKIANLIGAKTKGDIFKIEPLTPYPISHRAVVEQARREIMSGFTPQIKEMNIDFSSYDAIIVGTPNRWGTLAPPLRAFLLKNDFSYKRVGVFCTHSGDGAGDILKDVKNLLEYSVVREILPLYGNGGKQALSSVEKWLKDLGFNRQSKPLLFRLGIFALQSTSTEAVFEHFSETTL